MKIIETASQKRVHPKHPGLLGCMKYSFDTGHSAIKYSDGVMFFHNKRGNALNEKTGHKLISKMTMLIKEAEGK